MYFRQNLKIFAVLFFVFSFGVLFGLFLKDVGYVPGSYTRASVADSIEHREEIIVDLVIDYGNGDIQSLPQEKIMQGDSVYDVLEMLEEEKGIGIETRNFPGLGKFIEAIHGVHSTNNFYWQYWVNDEYAKVAAELYILDDGDRILWKRTNEI